MNTINFPNYSHLEVSRMDISKKLNQLLIQAEALNSQEDDFAVYYNERTAVVKEHVDALINDCKDYLEETTNSDSLGDLMTQDDLDYLEAAISFFEFKIKKHLDVKSVEPFSSVALLPEHRDDRIKPLIPEDPNQLFEMADGSVEPIITGGPELIDLDRPDGELKGEWFMDTDENTITNAEAEKEGEKKGLMKMRKWRWLAVAQLPASYPYALEAYEFYKPFAIDAYNTTIQMYNTYAPQVLETVSGWFN